jgi:hypothetical protein
MADGVSDGKERGYFLKVLVIDKGLLSFAAETS